MRNSRLFAFLLIWFAFAVFASFFVSAESAPAIAALFALIAIAFIAIELLLRSGTFDFILQNLRARPHVPRDDLSRTAFYIGLASRRRAYGFREVALILREAVFTSNLDSFPPNWIATPIGDAVLTDLLNSKNAADLLDVFKIPDLSAEKKSQTPNLSRASYLSKLDRALNLIEEKNP